MNRSFTHWTTLVLAAVAMVFISASAFAQTVTITDPNCSDFTWGGVAGARTITCVPIAGPPANPPSCTISGPAAGTIGTPIQLTANCGPGPITAGSYVWKAAGTAICAAGNSTCNDSGTNAPAAGGQVNYTVAASNAAGAGSASLQYGVNWSPAGGGGGGGGGGVAINCNGMNVGGFTVANTVVIEEKWSNTIFPRQFTSGYSYLSALVVHFKTGNLTAPGKNGAVTLFESGSPPSPMSATISTSPCDFGGGLGQAGPSNSIQVFFQVGGTPVAGGPAILNTNTDYYVNVFNVQPASCAPSANNPGGDCTKGVDFGKPRGL